MVDDVAHERWRCTCGSARELPVRRDDPDCPWHHGDLSDAPLAVRVAKRMEHQHTGDRIVRAQRYINAVREEGRYMIERVRNRQRAP